MKKIQQTADGKNYTAVSVGELSQLGEYVLQLGPNVKIPGKVFLGKALNATGADISFQRFEAGQETGFLHTHKRHEELYIIVSGQGEFQVDDQIFAVGEGSVVRVAPDGRRSLRNNSSEPMVMICVQYRGNLFDATDDTDAAILKEPVKW